MTRWLAIPLACLIALPGAPAGAHGTCGPRDSFVAQLAARYGEVRQGGALPNSIMHRELYASKRTGTWTRLRSHMSGIACVEGAGSGWRPDPPAEPVPSGAPA